MGVSRLLDGFIQEQQLPDSFETLARDYYLPLANWVAKQQKSQGQLVLGINGCQGSGKSTLADFLHRWLSHHHQLRVAQLSIDDLYLTRAERQQLATSIHPLLLTRGVPGTHDTAMGIALIEQLLQLPAGQRLALPRFDKANDDRLPESAWPVIEGPIDIILLEGWCIGAQPQADAALLQPVNTLEKDEDPDGRWRRFVNQKLAQSYQELFSHLQRLVMLKAPSFDCVFHWRLEQEQKLASRGDGRHLMSEADIQRFIQHYQRLTEAMLCDLPSRADVVLTLNHQHQITDARYR